MKFFVDTAEIDQIRELNDLGMVDGVTTNPSLIKKSGRDIIEVTKEICAMVSGPVSAEVTSTDADTMIAEGRKLVLFFCKPSVVGRKSRRILYFAIHRTFG